MNKKDLIEELAARVNLPKCSIALVLDSVGDVAKEHLVAPGAEMQLPGIGKLKAVAKAERTARNPQTGEEVQIPARTVLKLVVAKSLKDAVA